MRLLALAFLLPSLTLAARAQMPPTQATAPVTLTWAASSTTGATYNVYRLAGACPAVLTGGTKIASALTTLSFADTTVTTGLWCYWGTTQVGTVESGPSVAVLINVAPQPPQGFTGMTH